MKILSIRVLVVLAIVLFPIVNLYSQKSEAKPTKKQIEWFDKKDWLLGVKGTPDASLDIATFALHYTKHPERWKKVFEFLRDNDLNTLPLGKQTLGDDITVNVQEYMTREPGNEVFEGHRKYIDLQYVVSGRELQAFANINDTIETIDTYNEKKDVGHYKVAVVNYHVIRPNQFTIFFPADIHLPNIQYGEKEKVRKVVFKIPVD